MGFLSHDLVACVDLLYCCHIRRLLKNVAPVVGRRLGSDGAGISKRLNPGRNEVNVADAIEHACDLAQDYSVSGVGKSS